jgi:hypothetical protein
MGATTPKVYYSEQNEPTTANIESHQPRVSIHRPIIVLSSHWLQDCHNCAWFLGCLLNEGQIKWQLPLSLHSAQGGRFSSKPKCRVALCNGQRLEARETRVMDGFALQPTELKILEAINAMLLQICEQRKRVAQPYIAKF